jgi:hypothetical protein
MRSRSNDNEFNTPEEMLVRATFLVCLAAFTAGILLMLAGAAMHDLRLVGAGGLSLAIAGFTRGWLRRRGKLDDAGGTLHQFAEAGVPSDAARVAELVRLLRKWDQLESRRGSPAFDPWAVQDIRHYIRAMIETDPALENLFHDSRRAA